MGEHHQEHTRKAGAVGLQEDFHYEVNDEGTWRPALCAEVHGSDNGVFIVFGAGDQAFTIAAPRGTDAGCFRERQA